jgi:hypothetical protein
MEWNCPGYCVNERMSVINRGPRPSRLKPGTVVRSLQQVELNVYHWRVYMDQCAIKVIAMRFESVTSVNRYTH